MKRMFDDFHKMASDAEARWNDLHSKMAAEVKVSAVPTESTQVHRQFNASAVSQRFKTAGRFVMLAARMLWSGTVAIKLTKK